MKAILVDDERYNLDNLEILIGKYCPGVRICGTALDSREATGLLYSCRPDLVFLDIQMPGQNGFEWLQSLPDISFGVIFVTAFDQYAIRALRLAAIDYLLKPISIDELQIAVERAGRLIGQREQDRLWKNLIENWKESPGRTGRQIALPTAMETRFVRTDEIIWCQSANNYMTFHFVDGEALVVCKPIYLYDDLLGPDGFIRCHQSYLVNKAFVKSWKREYGDFLLLSDGSEVPVARNRKESLKTVNGLITIAQLPCDACIRITI
ncbi:LytTR family DNA-binding domain-containing protein [Dyadobacter sp. 676]|uniref:LytTR family DNA-binding domain-containing protein n=1 Tax=Dyadobacter sp. 676 TaxID=3088362 RepID=A0AAU8FI06_9BACT